MLLLKRRPFKTCHFSQHHIFRVLKEGSLPKEEKPRATSCWSRGFSAQPSQDFTKNPRTNWFMPKGTCEEVELFLLGNICLKSGKSSRDSHFNGPQVHILIGRAEGESSDALKLGPKNSGTERNTLVTLKRTKLMWKTWWTKHQILNKDNRSHWIFHLPQASTQHGRALLLVQPYRGRKGVRMTSGLV